MESRKMDLNFSLSPLGDEALKEEMRYKEQYRSVLNKDLTSKFIEELKLTSYKHNPTSNQNIEIDVIGRRRSGKSYLALKIIELAMEKIGGFDFDINEHLFYTNQDLVDYLMDNITNLKNVWLWKDEEHLEIGQDSVVNRIKVERFADECGKKRINIIWCSVSKQYMINTDYTIRRLDFDRTKNVARSIVLDGVTGVPLGCIFTGLPSQKMLTAYEKAKDEHLKTLLVGERILDYRNILRDIIDYFDLTDKKISKKELKTLIGLKYGDLSLSQIDSIVSTYSLWKKGFISLDVDSNQDCSNQDI